MLRGSRRDGAKLDLEGQEEMAKDQFILGLADAEMRHHASLAPPTTLDKAIALPTEFDVVSQASRSHVQHKPKPVSVVQDSQLSVSGDRELLQQILETLTKLTDRQSKPPRNKSNIKCVECQEVGHIKRNCRKLMQNRHANWRGSSKLLTVDCGASSSTGSSGTA